jgi:hypothetical protein
MDHIINNTINNRAMGVFSHYSAYLRSLLMKKISEMLKIYEKVL